MTQTLDRVGRGVVFVSVLLQASRAAAGDDVGRGVVFVSVLVMVLLVGTGIVTVAAQSAPDCSTMSYSGDGTDTNPYKVSNVDQLQCIEEQDPYGSSYEVVSDIDASETSSWNSGKGFNPIGGRFGGTFDGQGHSISGLSINRIDNVGLFDGVGGDGTVMRVSVVDASINGSSDVGGIAGINFGTIKKSYATGEGSGSSSVGGLVGQNSETSRISESHATGTVDGSGQVGGLAGVNKAGVISESYAVGDVNGVRS